MVHVYVLMCIVYVCVCRELTFIIPSSSEPLAAVIYTSAPSAPVLWERMPIQGPLPEPLFQWSVGDPNLGPFTGLFPQTFWAPGRSFFELIEKGLNHSLLNMCGFCSKTVSLEISLAHDPPVF